MNPLWKTSATRLSPNKKIFQISADFEELRRPAARLQRENGLRTSKHGLKREDGRATTRPTTTSEPRVACASLSGDLNTTEGQKVLKRKILSECTSRFKSIRRVMNVSKSLELSKLRKVKKS